MQPNQLNRLDNGVAMMHDETSTHVDDGDLNKTKGRDEIKELKQLSKAETRRVRVLRLLVTFLLFVTGISVTLATYSLLVKEQEKNFEDAYNQFASTVKDSIISNQLEIREAGRTLIDFMAIYTRTANMSWPMYDFADHDALFEEQVESKGIEGMGVLTFVPDEEKEQFLKYEEERCEARLMENHMRYFGHLDYFVPGTGNVTYDLTAEGLGISPKKDWYSIIRYRYPPLDSCAGLSLLDFNTVPHIQQAVNASLHLRNETVNSIENDYIESTEDLQKVHLEQHSQLPDDFKTDFPHSYMFLPIQEVLHDPTSPVVGFLFTNMAYDLALQNMLPHDIGGIYVVGANNCGQQFTYRIDGKEAYFIGDGDLHPPQYTSYDVHVDIDFSIHPEIYRATPGVCYYWMDIYPSDAFKDLYVNDTPAIFAAAVASTFFVMILTFFLYDLFVQRRNRKLLLEAAKSNGVITSLFPGDFREKILAEKEEEQVLARKSVARRSVATVFSSATANAHVGGDDVEDNQPRNGDKPLAALYPNTTIFFADLVGFTKWSSARTPTEVFELLEGIYGEFDKIAKKRKVYKVETIGDCYVAVTGLPEPDDRHAIVMARFSQDCLLALNQVTRTLSATLGPECVSLAMRVGLHSGPVTAGVLRGERSRFQLFGDSVNVAARMESNGQPGRIHISESTANLLNTAGKSSWITLREELIEAKGKGKMQTYWLTPTSIAASSCGTDMSGISGASGASEVDDENNESAQDIDFAPPSESNQGATTEAIIYV